MEMLELNDISDLCVLGVLFEDARNLHSLLSAVRMLDVETWQPTSEVIYASVERLMDSAAVVKLEAGNDTYFSITGVGVRMFFSLMKRPMPTQAKLRETVLSLKSSFLEILPRTVCKCVVEELIGFYNCQLSCIEKECGNCPLNSQRKQIKNDRQLFHIKQELQWLEKVTERLDGPLDNHQVS